MMRYTTMAILALIALIAVIVLAIQHTANHSLTYEQFISIMLTALGVILGALAIIIGIAAIWGYTTIVERAERAAEAQVTKKLDDMFASGSVEAMVNQQVSLRMEAETDRLFKDVALTTGVTVTSGEVRRAEGEKASESIAQQYPSINDAKKD
jgi:hypothetical protein